MERPAQINSARKHQPDKSLALSIALPALVVAAVIALLAQPPPSVDSAGSDGLRVLRSDANSVLLELSVSSYRTTQRSVDGVKFDVLEAPGLALKADAPGAPQLPVRGAAVGVPQAATVAVRVLEAQSEEIPQPLSLLPGPTEQIDSSSGDPLTYQNLGHKYVRNAALYARSTFEPQSPVVLGTAGFMRSQRFVQLSLYPFAYNPAQQKVRWIRRLTVELVFGYAQGQSPLAVGAARDEGAYEKVLQSNIVNYDSARTWRTPARGALSPNTPASPSSPASAGETYKIAVNQDGIYRLTQPALSAAGLSPSADPRTFQIKKNGVELPIYVFGEGDGVFDPGDYVEFYAQGVNTVYTDTNVYWLTAGVQNGLRMGTRSVAPAGGTSPTSFGDRLHVEENHYFVGDRPTDPNGDHWYWNVVCSCFSPNPFFVHTPGIYTFTLQDFDPTLSATLRANIFGGGGASVGDTTSPHEDQLYVNGNLVTDDAWLGVVEHQSETSFPEAYLVSGTNTISFSLILTGGASFDSLFVNWFEVDYSHQYVARNDYAPFTVGVSGSVNITLTNFSGNNLALYDVSQPTSTVRLTGFGVNNSGGGYALALSDNRPVPARYVAFGAPLMPLGIARYAPRADLRSAGNAADEIIIAADDFYTASATLASFRASQGLRVVRASISDIYDQFNDGVFDATAIRTFLAYAYQNWQAPAPLYVVLVGDGWMNYRNYQPSNLGTAKTDFIPPLLDAVDPFINMTATDNRFVNIVGADIAPDMAIGRLPVRSAAEATTVIGKIVAYEQNPGPADWHNRIDFFTDNYFKADGSTDTAGNFYAVADGIISDTIPQTFSVTKVYYDPIASPGDPVYINDGAQDTYLITSSLSAGALFANYVGHAAQFQWADNPTLFGNAGSAFNVFDSVQNGGLTPIVLELTCRTGQFHLFNQQSLGPNFVTAVGTGAVADWASTGLGVNDGHDQLARGFYSAVFSDVVPSIGLAINASKYGMVAADSFLDLVDEFTLFGDPAMRIQSPIPLADVGINQSAAASNGLMPGSLVTFTLRFANGGNITATAVSITDVVPAGLVNISFTSSGASVTPQGGAPYIWSVSDLAPNGQGIITITAQVDSTYVNNGILSLINTAHIGTGAPEVYLANNSASATLAQIPDLVMSKWAGASNGLRPGSALTFTLTYSNAGGSTASGVLISDVLASGLLAPSYTSSGAAITQTGGAPYAWSVADLAPGAGGVITLTATADSSFMNSGALVLSNTATINAATPDVNAGNNRATAYVYQTADLTLAKSAQSADGLNPGSAITFTLSYLNRGGSTASGVVITDILPGGLLNGAFTSSGAVVTPTGPGTFVWKVADLPVGAGGIITITATADNSFVNSNTVALTNTATIATASQELDTSNNTASAVVRQPFDLAISKSAQSSRGLAAGSLLTFTLRYTNVGGATAAGVVISDVLPAGLTAAAFKSSGASVFPTGSLFYVWNVVDLPPGAGGVITITAKADSSFWLRRATVLTNTVSIRSADAERNLGNNSAAASVLSGFRILYMPLVGR